MAVSIQETSPDDASSLVSIARRRSLSVRANMTLGPQRHVELPTLLAAAEVAQRKRLGLPVRVGARVPDVQPPRLLDHLLRPVVVVELVLARERRRRDRPGPGEPRPAQRRRESSARGRRRVGGRVGAW